MSTTTTSTPDNTMVELPSIPFRFHTARWRQAAGSIPMIPFWICMVAPLSIAALYGLVYWPVIAGAMLGGLGLYALTLRYEDHKVYQAWRAKLSWYGGAINRERTKMLQVHFTVVELSLSDPNDPGTLMLVYATPSGIRRYNVTSGDGTPTIDLRFEPDEDDCGKLPANIVFTDTHFSLPEKTPYNVRGLAHQGMFSVVSLGYAGAPTLVIYGEDSLTALSQALYH